ncbi:MAG: sigma-70 family RNA polymerase sigma factor [Anaerolineales bacterium]|nr:sigma-70 family RNA polymerase sigma factor [Anaerolineales bacterium]
MDEQTLIHSAQRGDLEAFNQLVLLYQGFLFRIALNILGDEDTAADATQQAFLSAFRNLRAFRGGSLRSWLSRIVVNACYDELRRISRAKNVPLQIYNEDDEEMEPTSWLADPNPSPEARAETNELLDTIQVCLQALPEHYRLVVQLVDVEGLSYEETAAVLDIPTGTIKSRLARARNFLRTSLQRYPDLIPAAYILDLSVAANIC